MASHRSSGYEFRFLQILFHRVHHFRVFYTDYIRSYVGIKDIGTDNNSVNEFPVMGSTYFSQSINPIMEINHSFVYNKYDWCQSDALSKSPVR